MSAPLVCPIRNLTIAIIGTTIIQASLAHPKYAESLQGTLEKDDKNCNTHNCAMCNKRRKCCGLITA